LTVEDVGTELRHLADAVGERVVEGEGAEAERIARLWDLAMLAGVTQICVTRLRVCQPDVDCFISWRRTRSAQPQKIEKPNQTRPQTAKSMNQAHPPQAMQPASGSPR